MKGSNLLGNQHTFDHLYRDAERVIHTAVILKAESLIQ